MNTIVIAFFCLVAAASASHIGLWAGHEHAINPAAHIPSGSVSVSADGAVIAGPAGSVHTDNGLHGHGAGANVAGPAGDVRTHAGSVVLFGPGNGHGDDGAWNHGGNGGWGHGGAVLAAPVVLAAAPVAAGYGHGAWGHGAWGHVLVGPAVVGHGLIGHGHHGW